MLVDAIKNSKKYSLLAALLVTSLISTGCARFVFGDKSLGRNPIEKPVVNITSFTDSLECMDELLIQYEVPVITVTAQDIPNRSTDNNVTNGAKEMFITAVSKMTERSGRIRFISFGSDLRDIVLLQQVHSKKDSFAAPDFFIRGGVTQYDRNVIASRIGAGLSHEDWNTSISGGQGISFAGLDLNAGLVRNLQMLPGVTSNNVLAIYDRGLGTEVGARINSVGTFFDFGLDKQDGLGQAIRNMVDLGAIEVVGKLYDIPYLTCLPIKFDAPYTNKLILKEYKRYRDNYPKLIRTIQAKLKHNNYYRGDLTGKLDQNTYLSIEYFRSLSDLPARKGDEMIDFGLYKALLYGKKYGWENDNIQSYDALNTNISRNKTPLKFDKYDEAYPKLNMKPADRYNSQPDNILPLKSEQLQVEPQREPSHAPKNGRVRENETVNGSQGQGTAPEIPAPIEIEIIDQNGQKPRGYYNNSSGVESGANYQYPEDGAVGARPSYGEKQYIPPQKRLQDTQQPYKNSETYQNRKSIWDTTPYY